MKIFRNKVCGAKLTKHVIVNGMVQYSPLKIYCHQSVINALQNLWKRPGFIRQCNQWNERNAKDKTF